MKIGVPKEIKIHEYRVGLVPAGVRELVDSGHQVLVQSGAGAGIGFEDSHYQSAGAAIAQRAQDIFAASDLIVKVKEPQLAECKQLRSGQVLFTYLHLAPIRNRRRALLASGATAIAYETVTAPDGSLPLLTPMSEVAGRMSVQVGANSLQKANGGFESCWEACPEWRPPKSWCWAAAFPALTRRRWPSVCAQTSPWSIARSGDCGSCPRSSVVS